VILLDVAETNNKTNEVDTIVNGLSKDDSLINSQIDIMSSRSLAERVIDRLDLMAYPEFEAVTRPLYPRSWLSDDTLAYLPAFVGQWLGGAKASPPSADALRNVVVDYLLKRLDVENDGTSYTVQLSYEAEDPELAATIANTFAGLYLTTRLEYKQDTSEKRAKWLANKLDELRQRVVAADRAVQDFRERNKLVDVRENSLVNEQLAGLGTELVAATAARLKAESILRGARGAAASRATASPQSLLALSPSVAELQTTENDLRTELAQQRAELGPRHPEIISLQDKLQGVEDRLDQETARALRGFEADLEVARAQEDALARRVEESEAQNETTNRATIQLKQLTAEADAARGLLNSFLEGANQTWAGADVYDPDARVLSPATIPQRPSYPPQLLLILLTVAGAFVLAVATVVVLELLDTTYHDPVDLERAHGVPVLGLVPLTRRLAYHPTSDAQNYPHPSSEVIERPWSPFSEAVQSIYTLLTRSTTGQPPSVILVTSAVPEEGKTSLALALGRLAARAGKRVLLIDCDLRRPAVGRYLGCTSRRGRGLVELLRGEVTLEEVVRVDERSGMAFVPATPHCSLPVELLASESMRRLVKEASKKFQLVILDSAPVIPVADGLVLAALADTTLLAVRWGKTARSLVATALKNLAAVGKPVTAAAFSHVHLRQYATYTYGYYPIGYASATGPDLDGESDVAPRGPDSGERLMTRPYAAWRAIWAVPSGHVVLATVIALALVAWGLYANMNGYFARADAEHVASTSVDQAGDAGRVAKAPQASTAGPLPVSAPDPVPARNGKSAAGTLVASEATPPSVSEARPQAAPTASPEPRVAAVDGASPYGSGGNEPVVLPLPAGQAATPPPGMPTVGRQAAPTMPPAPEAGHTDGAPAALTGAGGPPVKPPAPAAAVHPPSPPSPAPDARPPAVPAVPAEQDAVGTIDGAVPEAPESSRHALGSPPSNASSPQPLPAANPAQPPGLEAPYRVQLASYHSMVDAEKAWDVLSPDLRQVLAGLQLNVESAETSRGVFYRLQAGPLETAKAASAVCERVREHGADCFVVRLNGA
jgi:capsular exopolysaccharide synthesis family protein